MNCKFCGNKMLDVSNGITLDTVTQMWTDEYKCSKCGATVTKECERDSSSFQPVTQVTSEVWTEPTKEL